MIDLSTPRAPHDFTERLAAFWDLSGQKITSLAARFDPANGAPVYTVEGRYTTRGWTDWTQGFQVGAALLQYDATDDPAFLDLGRTATCDQMAPHLTHFGVHDHGFNNVSTYGALLRLMDEGRLPENDWERRFYTLALQCSGAVQAHRWTPIADGGGFIYSFNGPHSLFADTMRSLRSLALAHQLGHQLKGEHDETVSLFDRLVAHAEATARYIVYYGTGRDGYDRRGRVVHEALFNTNDGRFRCPSTQQGYTPFSTWTRGLAWVMCGYAEQLEYLTTRPTTDFEPHGGREEVVQMMTRAARATCDFYLEHTPPCGVPYWDTGAPGLRHLPEARTRPADPFNPHEPVDSSAAAIAAQGLLRLGHHLTAQDDASGDRYTKAGLKVFDTLLSPPYLSQDPDHEGLLLHSVYHWPNRWDHVPEGHTVACGESTMWGDYHLRELACYVGRLAAARPYLRFYGPVEPVI